MEATTAAYPNILTVIAAQDAPSDLDHYAAFIVMCPDDAAGDWFIYGDTGTTLEELHGPFSTRKAVRHFVSHALRRICRRVPVMEV